MPRTVSRKRTIKKEKTEEPAVASDEAFIASIQSILDRKHQELEEQKALAYQQANDLFDGMLTKLSNHRNMLIGDLEKYGDPAVLLCDPDMLQRMMTKNTCNNTTNNTTFVSASSSYLETQQKPKRRSRSADEGYRTESSSTAESTCSKLRNRRRSRSTVRTDKPSERFRTPVLRKANPNSYAQITPKVKPNVPQIILRRPAQGEVAWSSQGSPLFTGPVVSDSYANVNIPLPDGRLITIQPQRGLRTSTLPDVENEVREQLRTLRENITKILN